LVTVSLPHITGEGTFQQNRRATWILRE